MIIIAILLIGSIGFIIWAAVTGNLDMTSINTPF